MAVSGLVLLLLLAGASNPRPLGDLVMVDQLQVKDQWEVLSTDPAMSGIQHDAESTGYRVVSPSADAITLITAPYSIAPPCTIEFSMRQIRGLETTGYGLWWGVSAQDYLVTAINGHSYLTIFNEDEAGRDILREWQVFPHIRATSFTNVIRVDITGSSVTAWVNNERAVVFEWAALGQLRMGLYVETFAESEGATIELVSMRAWEASQEP